MKQGDTVFSDNGQELELVATTGDGYVVMPVYDGGDNEPPYTGEPFVIRKVYAEPPVAKWNKEVEDLVNRANDKRTELLDLTKQFTEFQKSEKDRLNRLKRHGQLALLDDYLAGKITYMVVHPDYGQISVMTVAEALKDEGKYEKNMKLLTLYGSSKGDLQFHIERYSDGSGPNSYKKCWPFLSEFAATEYAKKLIAQQLTAAVADANVRDYSALITNAETFSVDVPIELRDRPDKIKQAYKIKRIAYLTAELEKLKES
jgi:hypothetical protein